MAHLSADDIDRLTRAAIEAELAEPERRRMLLSGMPRAVVGRLPRLERPADQIRSDLTTLADIDDPSGLRSWLVQAGRVARDTRPLEAHLFTRYAAGRHAILAGVDGPEPSSRVKAALIRTGRLLDKDLGPDHRIGQVARFEACDGGAILDRLEHFTAGPSVEMLWIHLVGQVFVERRRLRLRTMDGQGLQLDELADVVVHTRAEHRVIVIDIDPGTDATLIDRLHDVDFGPSTLCVASVDATGQLASALGGGARTAGEVVAAVPGARSDRSDASLASGDRPRLTTVDGAHTHGMIDYLEALRRRCDRIPLHKRDHKLSALRQVYVPLYTSSPTDARGPQGERDMPPQPDRDTPPPTMHDRVIDQRCLFIVGEPGSGKTTTLQRLCADLCDVLLARGESSAPWMDERPLPVWLDLRDLPAPPAGQPCRGRALLDYAFAHLDRCDGREPLAAGVADAALAAGRLLLILDGLDEVPSPHLRRRWAEAITDLADTHARKARIWVSCREAARAAGAEPGSPFVRVDLQRFDRAQRGRVIAGWLKSRGLDGAELDGEVSRLLGDIERHPEVAKQAGVPLILAMICRLYFEGRGLPDSRVDLYTRLVDLFVSDREKQSIAPVQHIDAYVRREALTDLAWRWWHDGGGQAPSNDAGAALGLRQDTCVDVVEARLDERRVSGDRRALAGDLVDFFDQRAGMLKWQGLDAATGQRRFAFAHRTFAEFLVACRLSTEQDLREEHLTERFAVDPNWREVFVMFTALIGRAETGDRRPAWAWVEALSAWALSEGESPEARASCARLAAECLAPCRERATADVIAAVDAVQDALLDAEQCAGFPAVQRVAFWNAIGDHSRLVSAPSQAQRWAHLPGGRFWRGAADGDDMADDNERPAGWVEMSPFAIQRWPVLVLEYGEFVEHGYGDPAGATPPWWSEEGWAARVEGGWSQPAGWYRQRQGKAAHPVNGVSFWEAEAYAQWLGTEVMGLEPDAVGLPSEAQWERAARGLDEASARRRYPWGSADDPDRRNGEGAHDGTTPVGAFPAGCTPEGLHDLSGNVYEWCVDGAKGFSTPVPYEESPGRDPIHAPLGSARARRVVRGGAWHFVPHWLRVSYRCARHPASRFVGAGFRCVWRRAPRSSGLDPGP